ncbi:Bacteriophage T4 Gp32 single-stranded DNA-binding domain-containing protein [uncultured Gammaproteobacteria bacterium]
MALDLAKMRSKLAPQTNNKSVIDGSLYRFWNMKIKEQCTVRFLEDGNQANNSSFWVERQMINLEFPSTLGENYNKQVKLQVPCIEMFNPDANEFAGGCNLKCPVMEELRRWYKSAKDTGDDKLETLANKYWKKRTYFFQGFIRVNPIKEDVSPENPIRRLILGPQLFKILKSSLISETELEPTSITNGTNFNIRKNDQGGQANYTTSAWDRKNSYLTDREISDIEKYGILNLSKFLPKRPDDKTLEVIYEMFEASVEGNPYEKKWEEYFKPYVADKHYDN